MILAFLLASALPLSLERGPVVNDVDRTTAEIRWEPAISGAVLVLGSGASAVEVPATMRTDGVATARLTDLEPDRQYAFEVRVPGYRNEAGSFRTLPASADSPVSFIAFGDTRSNHEIHARLAASILAADPDFVVSTGDLVMDGRIAEDWAFFFQSSSQLLRRVPFFPAVGNHDERGVLGSGLIDRWFGRGPWYEVQAGAVIFLFIDSNLAFGGGSAQGAWLRERLTSAKDAKAKGDASWIVALHHHPAFSSASHGSTDSVQRELVPLYEEFGVDLVLNGHDHVYERLEANGTTYVVTGGGGAPLYDFGEALPETRVREKRHHYAKVDADRTSLTLTAIDLDGNVIDTHTLEAGTAKPIAQTGPASDTGAIGLALGSLAGAAGLAWLLSEKLVRGRKRPTG